MTDQFKSPTDDWGDDQPEYELERDNSTLPIPIRGITSLPSIGRTVQTAARIIARRTRGGAVVIGAKFSSNRSGISKWPSLANVVGAFGATEQLQPPFFQADHQVLNDQFLKKASVEKTERMKSSFSIDEKAGANKSAVLSDISASDKVVNVPSRLLEFLQERLGSKLPSVAVHRNRWADQILAAKRAEAMAWGKTIFVRRDSPDTTTAQGAGLLAHELTHIAQQQETRDWRAQGLPHPSSSEAEPAALRNERLAAVSFPYGTSYDSAGRRSQAPAGAAGASIAQFAADTRSQTSVTEESPQSPPGMSLDDIERIKDEIYRDLMLRIKTEFERGA